MAAVPCYYQYFLQRPNLRAQIVKQFTSANTAFLFLYKISFTNAEWGLKYFMTLWKNELQILSNQAGITSS